MRVKAICNFADDGHRQGDVFDVEEAEAERLIAVEAVELTEEETPQEADEPTAPVPAPDDVPTTDPEPSAQPTAEQVAATLAALDEPDAGATAPAVPEASQPKPTILQKMGLKSTPTTDPEVPVTDPNEQPAR